MRVRDGMNDEGLAAFRAGMEAIGATPEQVEAALDAEEPEAGSLAATQSFAGHGKVSGSHTHSHPAYARQGGDKTHEHMHRHDGDAGHSHHAKAKEAKTKAVAGAGHAFMTAPTAEEIIAGGHRRQSQSSSIMPSSDREVMVPWATDPERAEAIVAAAGAAGSLVAAAMEVLGSPWGVEQRGDDEWVLLGRDGEAGSFERYELAVEQLAGLAFQDGARPVLDSTWRSEMAFEDEETPDGRYIAPGGLKYRTPPLPLMLQTVTDIGHFGAILCGSIVSAKTSGGVALGSGEFDANPAGEQCLQIVEARGQFGVSIDGMMPADAEFECTARDEEGDCTDGRIRFNLLTVGGLTVTPFPAFPGAYIALEQRAQSAAGNTADDAERATGGDGDVSPQPVAAAADAPCVDCDEEQAAADAERETLVAEAARARAATIPAGKEDPVSSFTASANLASPPSEWFGNPGFRAGDGRTVRQGNGRWACPLTVTADGEVFGHMAGWFSCHTGYADKCVTPPRSKTGYAAFLLRPLMTADGTVVKVGHLSMGCGHASTAGGEHALSTEQVRAHYDGGPGAVRMAQVACGEDEFGVWFHGAIDPQATPAQVRTFQACSVSGDWRDVWGRGLELVACLAGVTVPGFPIAAAALAASAGVDDVGALLRGMRIDGPGYREVDGRPVALVAAGVVAQTSPEGRQIGNLAGRIDALEARLASAEAVTDELRALAVERLVEAMADDMRGDDAPSG